MVARGPSLLISLTRRQGKPPARLHIMKPRLIAAFVLSQILPSTTSFSGPSRNWPRVQQTPVCAVSNYHQYRYSWGSSVSSKRSRSQHIAFSTSRDYEMLDTSDLESPERGSWESDDDAVQEDEPSTQDVHEIAPSVDSPTSPLLEEFRRWSGAATDSIKGLEKKEKSLKNELQKAAKIEETVARAQLLTSHLYLFTPGVRSAVVQDWDQAGKAVELNLDPGYDSAATEADALFQRVRKLKRGSQVVRELLKETSKALGIMQEIILDMESVSQNGYTVNEDSLRFVQERLLRTARKSGFSAPRDDEAASSAKNPNQLSHQGKHKQRKAEMGTPASNVRKLTSPGGCTVLVGRNRRGNEYLSCQVAKGDDIWMHSRGCPGAHVVIQQRRGSSMATTECIQFGADLAVFYSDARSEVKAEVTAAEPKHVQKPRGAPLGAVKLREEWQVFTGFPDAVPDDLKQAREASGQLEEYRSSDKGLRRKRTKQATKDQEAKRNAKAKARRGGKK